MSAAAKVAVRVYPEEWTDADIEFERAWLRHVAASPAEVVVPLPAGEVAEGRDGKRVAAYRWIEGEPVDPTDTVAAAAAGRALAHLHDSSPSFAMQRPAWGQLADFALSERGGGWTLLSALVRFAQGEAVRASDLANSIHSLDAALKPLRKKVEAHLAVVHYDLHTGNILRQPDGTVAIIDWAFAHWDARTADLGIVMRSWPAGVDSFMAGYGEVAKSALTDEERAAIPLLAAARGLDHVGTVLTRWAHARGAPGDPEVIEEVDRELRGVWGVMGGRGPTGSSDQERQPARRTRGHSSRER